MDAIKSKLQRNRDAIDKIDRKLVQLLCERAKFGISKEQYDPVYETKVMERLSALNTDLLSENALKAIYTELIFAEVR